MQHSLERTIQIGAWDVYYRPTGLFHGVLVIATLIYFTFVHGPKSGSAPFTSLYYSCISAIARIPVYPDRGDSPKDYLEAVRHFHVWDDEAMHGVACSWSLFYVMMALGSLSLMMAVTNFTE